MATCNQPGQMLRWDKLFIPCRFARFKLVDNVLREGTLARVEQSDGLDLHEQILPAEASLHTYTRR